MLDRLDKICVVARGDGAVDVIYIELELATIKENNAAKSRKASQSRKKHTEASNSSQQRLHLDYSCGGHTASVSCVQVLNELSFIAFNIDLPILTTQCICRAFSEFNERGKFIISGGNDKCIKLWDVSKCLDKSQTNSQTDLLYLNISLGKKVKSVRFPHWFKSNGSSQ